MKPKALRIASSLTLTASADAGPRRFDIGAYSGGVLRVSGYDRPVVVDLTRVMIPDDGSIPLLIDHEQKTDATLGQTDVIQNTGQSLRIAGQITGDSDRCQSVLRRYDAGHKWQASIGGIVTEIEAVASGRTVSVNGRTFTGLLYVAREFLLREASVVPVGGDVTTAVNLAAAAAALKGLFAMSFEDWLKALGIDAAVLTEDAKAKFMKWYEAEQNPQITVPTVIAPMTTEATLPNGTGEPDEEEPEKLAARARLNLMAQLRQDSAIELRRQAEIRAKTEGFPLIAASAIEKGWTAEKTELEVLKAQSSQRAPYGHVKTTDNSPRVLEAALCQARKLPSLEKQFTDQEMQSAHTQYRGRIRLQQIILQAAAQNGYHVGPGLTIDQGNFTEIVHAAKGEGRLLQAAGSTLNVPGILSNVANKEIVVGYEQGDSAWREIASIKTVNDFKEVTTYRLLDNMEYAELPKGGQIQHGSLGEESYTRKAKTYAKMSQLDRVDIINDDLAAFDDLRKRLGLGASMALNHVFWKKFLASLATIFTAGRGNYISGATTNLGTDGIGLGMGVKAFRTMKSPVADGAKRVNADSMSGKGAGGKPEILLVGPSLEAAADKLYVGGNLNTGTAAGEENIYRNKYRPVVRLATGGRQLRRTQRHPVVPAQ
ncbi:MAG: hypothetical protein KF777_15725 [Planctomycetaceae bacterium]|nr:hypothetical protein [Planctomycetaceae bacterium]